MQKEPSHALSDIEKRIVQLVTQGYRIREIAKMLSLSEWTILTHLNDIFNALGLSDRLDLILYGIVHGFAAPAEPGMFARRGAEGRPAAA